MSQVSDEIRKICSEIPDSVRLIAVSKTHPMEAIMEAYSVGQRDFGENKVQELAAKASQGPDDIRWHMIGHLQTNKIKYIAPFVHLIHSVDSDKVLAAINKEGVKIGRRISCLLQVHIAQEETKFGFDVQELKEYLSSGKWQDYQSVEICGIMTMATNTDDMDQVSAEFEYAHNLFLDVQKSFFSSCPQFSQLSMGMSGDYELAIQHGATLVRVGSQIFGQRYYPPKPEV